MLRSQSIDQPHLQYGSMASSWKTTCERNSLGAELCPGTHVNPKRNRGFDCKLLCNPPLVSNVGLDRLKTRVIGTEKFATAVRMP